ncbi:hypothetical protein N7465_000252 [Penicillium sp. CMV-2018d]|nr:hypothetical protein N7465_000252 [Penicillium sp. CMV-2018d]
MKRRLERKQKDTDAATFTANPEAAIVKFTAETHAARVFADRTGARYARFVARVAAVRVVGATASGEVAGSKGGSEGGAHGSRTGRRDNSDLGEGRSLPVVIAGEWVELPAPQSTIASGTPQTLRGAPLDATPGTPAMAGGVTSAPTTSSVAGIKRELEPTSSVPPSSVGTPSTPADDGPAAKKIKVEPNIKPDGDAKIEPEVKKEAEEDTLFSLEHK